MTAEFAQQLLPELHPGVECKKEFTSALKIPLFTIVCATGNNLSCTRFKEEESWIEAGEKALKHPSGQLKLIPDPESVS
jgi:hypothetical protein